MGTNMFFKDVTGARFPTQGVPAIPQNPRHAGRTIPGVSPKVLDHRSLVRTLLNSLVISNTPFPWTRKLSLWIDLA